MTYRFCSSEGQLHDGAVELQIMAGGQVLEESDDDIPLVSAPADRELTLDFRHSDPDGILVTVASKWKNGKPLSPYLKAEMSAGVTYMRFVYRVPDGFDEVHLNVVLGSTQIPHIHKFQIQWQEALSEAT